MAAQSFKGFKTQGVKKNSNRKKIVERGQVAHTAERTLISGSEIVTKTLTLPQPLPPLLAQEAPAPVVQSGEVAAEENNDESLPKPKTQV